MSESIKYNVSFGRRLVLFLCITFIGWLISGVINELLLNYQLTTRTMRIAAVCQDVFQMIIPAIVTAIIVTRYPARFLCIDKKISLPQLIFGICAMLIAIPAMNKLILWNNSVTFPESMKAIETWMRTMEETAGGYVELLQGGSSVGDLIMSILIVGLFAGFAEEIIFRGTFLRILLGKVNPHVAIWIVAIVFSALHFQFYGFFPRLLLGAFFGYAFYWSGSLWLPVCLHAFNNILYVVTRWYYLRVGEPEGSIDSFGTEFGALFTGLSILFTAALIWCMKRCQTHPLQR